MSRTDVPYLKLMRGERYQPRWEPGPKLRAAGIEGRALKDDAGHWLDVEAARAAARALNAEAERRLSQKQPTAEAGKPKLHPRRVEALWETYKSSPRYKSRAPATQEDYANKAGVIIEKFGPVPVAALSKADLYNWWETLVETRGHTMANRVLAVFRLMLSYAERKGWRRDNPALKLELDGVPPRIVIWLPEECETFVAEADKAGHHGLADAFVLALHTSQRLSDVLALVEDKASDGSARFRQSKTNARVKVPLTSQLATRLEAARQRRRAGAVIDLAQLGGIIVRRQNGEPYTDRHQFNKEFREVRAAVQAKLDEAWCERGIDEPPQTHSKQFLDLRDTAITRLAEAGCDMQEIAAITGHSLNTIHTIMRHYLALSESMAIRGIDRLQRWMSENAIAV